MISKLLYYIGKIHPKVRTLIHKLTGKWYWGIIGWIKDNPTPPEELEQEKNTGEDWLDNQLNEIFSSGSKNKILWVTEKGKKQLKDLANKD